MYTQLNANLKAVELTQAELDSVTGGQSAAETHKSLVSQLQAQDMNDAIIQIFKSVGKGLKDIAS
jgi:hypothetical protein